jgi:aerobic-type carbon monoxide dehydrogenase small subunit (CoxS/CutS family)
MSHTTTEARGPDAVSITLDINGRKERVAVEPRATLLDTLRQKLGLTGSKRVCDSGSCGACTVLIDGAPVYACMTLAIACEGRRIQTIEGLGTLDSLHPIQQAFIDEDGFQCGFCTSGQIMAAKALLDANPTPNLDEIKRGMSGNLCRCGAYLKIFRSVKRASELLQKREA